ncbi:alkaline phosphatase synthesis sensor protein PhoR [Oxobacter pfennigii]|uniref:histidine kinase n=1 Tax=Oxobacter pfennigii TaxID=36849 RepID=A0A0P8WCS7_9CLOT|nr:HAMP domain-containing sensor histidine kinase [Oxobacter pfennigii]KPU45653.1 alkaline phosphatase synthesis sensor protein PhoR [Oxobacter pfennigii]
MKSIRTRLAGYFMLVIIITVSILEVFLISAVKTNYYNNVEEILSNQIVFSSEFYSRYFPSSSLGDNILDNIDVFWQQTAAQVQIIDLSGNVLMDSIGVDHKESLDTSDVKKALQGEKGRWVGNVEYDSYNVMAVSYPLKSDGNIIGVLRFITSLKETDKAIRSIAMIFIWTGIAVVFISGLVSIFLSNTITRHVKEVTLVAEKMASGNLKIRSIKKYNDEIGKLSDTLNFMAEEIVKKEQLKNEFISSVSHELRTPLTSIKGWAITLKSSKEGEKELLEDGLNIIEQESDRLTHMVEELLDFSRFVSGKISLNKEDVDIYKIIKNIDKQLSPRANAENIDFTVWCPDGASYVYGDENRLRQVFINILDNAFKFTSPKGMVALTAKEEGENVVIRIKDNGSGISKEDLPYVKERFHKGKSSKSKNGLGLSICDEIVKLHGGSLEIKSEQGMGTEVVVILPAGGYSND